jgi:hypothetical protein
MKILLRLSSLSDRVAITGTMVRESDSLVWLYYPRSDGEGKAAISNNTVIPPAHPLEAYWLIVQSEAGQKEVLIVELDSREGR